MNWKFWEKNKSDKSDTGVKLAKPKDLPQSVGRYLVVNLKYDPDWVWGLKVAFVGKEASKDLFDFRIFDPNHARTKGMNVKNYRSLDENADMIFFDGCYNKRTDEMKINNHYESLKAKIPA